MVRSTTWANKATRCCTNDRFHRPKPLNAELVEAESVPFLVDTLTTEDAEHVQRVCWAVRRVGESTAVDGLRSVAAVHACVESAAREGAWVDARPPMFQP